MHDAEPNWDIINIVNGIYGFRNYETYIWTARGQVVNENQSWDDIYWTTYRWLMTYGVRFHELDIDKISYTFQIDDKTINLTHL